MKQILFSNLFLTSLLFAQETPLETDLTQESTQKHKSKTSQDATKSTPLETLEIKKSSKSGILLGVEAATGWGAGESEGYLGDQLGLSERSFFESKSSYSKINLLVGYQKYFGEKETLGFDIKAKGGIGLLSNLSLHQASYLGNGIIGRVPKLDTLFLYTSFSAGIEANFLYDFFQKNNHTLGMSAGLGYDFVYGKNFYTNATDPEDAHLLQNKNISLSILSPKLGLHYYYKHHQFGLKVSFDKAFGKNVASAQDPESSEAIYWESKFNFFVTTHLSYAYRF